MPRNIAALTIVLAGAVCAYGQEVFAFNHIVDRSVEFFRGTIGPEMPKSPHPFASVPWEPGAQSRSAFLYIPGSEPWVSELKAAGATMISKNGDSVIGGPKVCMLRDPNNLFVELAQTVAGKL